MSHLVIPPDVTKEPLVCPTCAQKFGYRLGEIYRSRPVDRHAPVVAIGPLPAMILCRVCGTVWRNPSWTFADEPEAIERQIAELPAEEAPLRNWAAVPSRLRPVGLRGQW